MPSWKVLTDYLKPGDLIKIRLYSELARRHIVAARGELDKNSILDGSVLGL